MKKAVALLAFTLLCGCAPQTPSETPKTTETPAPTKPQIQVVESPEAGYTMQTAPLRTEHAPDWMHVFLLDNKLYDKYGNRLLDEDCFYYDRIEDVSGQTDGYLLVSTAGANGEEQLHLYDAEGRYLWQESSLMNFYPDAALGTLISFYDQAWDSATGDILWEDATEVQLTPHRIFVQQGDALTIYDEHRNPIKTLSGIEWFNLQETNSTDLLITVGMTGVDGIVILDADGTERFRTKDNSEYLVGHYENRLMMQQNTTLRVYDLTDGTVVREYANTYGEVHGQYLLCREHTGLAQWVVGLTDLQESDKINEEDYGFTVFENGNYLRRDGLYHFDGTPIAIGYQYTMQQYIALEYSALPYWTAYRQEDVRIFDLLDNTGKMIVHNIKNIECMEDFFYIEQGFSRGTIDTEGNWLFRESAFANLED